MNAFSWYRTLISRRIVRNSTDDKSQDGAEMKSDQADVQVIVLYAIDTRYPILHAVI